MCPRDNTDNMASGFEESVAYLNPYVYDYWLLRLKQSAPAKTSNRAPAVARKQKPHLAHYFWQVGMIKLKQNSFYASSLHAPEDT